MSTIKPLIDALPFIRFTDAGVGVAFVKALRDLDDDLEETGYTIGDDEVVNIGTSLENLTSAISDAVEELVVTEEAEEALTIEQAHEAQEAVDAEIADEMAHEGDDAIDSEDVTLDDDENDNSSKV